MQFKYYFVYILLSGRNSLNVLFPNIKAKHRPVSRHGKSSFDYIPGVNAVTFVGSYIASELMCSMYDRHDFVTTVSDHLKGWYHFITRLDAKK